MTILEMIQVTLDQNFHIYVMKLKKTETNQKWFFETKHIVRYPLPEKKKKKKQEAFSKRFLNAIKQETRLFENEEVRRNYLEWVHKYLFICPRQGHFIPVRNILSTA